MRPLLRRRALFQLRGIAKQAALKDQRNSAPLTLTRAESSCARGAWQRRFTRFRFWGANDRSSAALLRPRAGFKQ